MVSCGIGHNPHGAQSRVDWIFCNTHLLVIVVSQLKMVGKLYPLKPYVRNRWPIEFLAPGRNCIRLVSRFEGDYYLSASGILQCSAHDSNHHKNSDILFVAPQSVSAFLKKNPNNFKPKYAYQKSAADLAFYLLRK